MMSDMHLLCVLEIELLECNLDNYIILKMNDCSSSTCGFFQMQASPMSVNRRVDSQIVAHTFHGTRLNN